MGTEAVTSNTDDWDFDDAVAEWAPATVVARVCFDQKLVDEIEQLERSLPESPSMDDAREAASRLAGLIEQLRGKERPFTMVALPKLAYSDLLGMYPPTPAQLAADRRLDHNPETFPQALIVASCQTPKLTAERVEWMATHLSFGQFNRLWYAALQVNIGNDGVGKVLSGTAALLATQPSSTTAAPEASPAASSSDES